MIPPNAAALAAEPKPAEGYCMAKSLSIKNFRCFRSLELSGLSPVNVIVGPNGSGKTALMEALFLLAARAPTIAARLRRWRGLSEHSLLADTDLGALWADLFPDFDPEFSISLALTGEGHDRQLDISQRPVVSVPVEFSSEPSVPVHIQFSWTIDSQRHIATPRLVGKNIEFEPVPPGYECSMFGAHVPFSGEEAARRLSRLSKDGRAPSVKSTFRRAFPQVRDISNEEHDGVFIPHFRLAESSRPLPAPLVSAGMSRFLAILLGIAECKGGLVFVDELENGIYHKAMPDVWQGLLKFAREFRTQVFVSTHSAECLQALRPLLSRHPIVSLIQFQGVGQALVYDGTSLEAALLQEFEVR